MNNIFDATFNGMGGGELYRAQLVPELYPAQLKPHPRFENWSDEDKEAYCGIYTDDAKALIRIDAMKVAA